MVTKIGSEFVVNSASDTDAQRSPEIAALSGGGFVETWIDVINPGAPTLDVRAQIFDASGHKVGAEIDLGVSPIEYTVGITGLASNAFAISWGDGAGVHIQLFNSAGQPSGAPNGVPPGGGGSPALETLTNGNLAAIYEFNFVGSPGQAHGDIYDPSGNLVQDFVAGSTPTSTDRVFQQDIAALTTGGLVAVWEDIIQPGIFAQRLDAQGNLVGSQITVTGLAVEGAMVAPLAHGAFVVVWDQVSAVEARLFDANGNPVGGQFQVNTKTNSFVDNPSIATLGNGQFVVVWKNAGNSGNASVEGQLLNADGTKSGSEFTVTTAMSPTEFVSPKVAALGHDEFVVTWDSPGSTDGTTNTIHSQILEAPTANFTAGQSVNMKNLPGLHPLLTHKLTITHLSKTEIKGHIGQFTYDLRSAPGHNFTLHGKHVTGGTIGSFEVDANGKLDYKFTGLDLAETRFGAFINSHAKVGALTGLLLGQNDVITGSHGNDVLVGGPDTNTYIFTKHFGHDRIPNLALTDIIEISRKTFHDIAGVVMHSHLVHGHVVIAADAHDSIALSNVTNLSDLAHYHFMFI